METTEKVSQNDTFTEQLANFDELEKYIEKKFQQRLKRDQVTDKDVYGED